MGIECHDGVSGRKKRGGHGVRHIRQWLLLPEGVEPRVWSREAVWEAASKSENRKDAREGRFFDISWPRELPTERIDRFVLDLYGEFVVMGLAVQIDWETSPAEDGLDNDHIHGLISTRTLSNLGFAKSKCRKLDAWFRTDVRNQVADLFNEIAKGCGIDVRFDPAPNAVRDDALPPEDRLPRRRARDRAGQQRLQRDRQRALRREHEQVMVQMKSLERQAGDLQAQIHDQFEQMIVLTSLQGGDSEQPLPVQVAMSSFIGAGIALDERLWAEGIGGFFVIGGTILVDVGDRILIEGVLDASAVRAMHLLARCKGWRDLSLTDPGGMPLPVPSQPSAVSRGGARHYERSPRERLAKENLIRAARSVLQKVRAADPDSRRKMMSKVASCGNRGLERFVTELVCYTGQPKDLSVEVVQDMLARANGEAVDLWSRYRVEQDLGLMLVPGTQLAQTLRPPPRFYDFYPVPPSDAAKLALGKEVPQ